LPQSPIERRFRVEREIEAVFDRALLHSRCATASRFCEATMRFPYGTSIVFIFAICLTWSAVAQNARSPDQPAPNATVQQETLTGKERLGPKWTDEQRIDNCKVPVDKRGTKPRSSACPPIPTG
jgi:hypothetical protein